jgi:indolepyruvate ferredoxin oxidoreductase
MAYKDEYEVARLYSDGRFRTAFDAQFSGGTARVQLSPPIFAKTDPATGRPKKYEFGPWVFTLFGVLAKLKGLRGTAFDVFGYAEERKAERAAIGAYEATVDKLLAGLTADNAGLATEIASLPLSVRGYGPVRDKAAKETAAKEAALWAKWHGAAQRAAA